MPSPQSIQTPTNVQILTQSKRSTNMTSKIQYRLLKDRVTTKTKVNNMNKAALSYTSKTSITIILGRGPWSSIKKQNKIITLTKISYLVTFKTCNPKRKSRFSSNKKYKNRYFTLRFNVYKKSNNFISRKRKRFKISF